MCSESPLLGLWDSFLGCASKLSHIPNNGLSSDIILYLRVIAKFEYTIYDNWPLFFSLYISRLFICFFKRIQIFDHLLKYLKQYEKKLICLRNVSFLPKTITVKMYSLFLVFFFRYRWRLVWVDLHHFIVNFIFSTAPSIFRSRESVFWHQMVQLWFTI